MAVFAYLSLQRSVALSVGLSLRTSNDFMSHRSMGILMIGITGCARLVR